MPAGAVDPISSSGLHLAKLTAGDVRFRSIFGLSPCIGDVRLTPVNGPRQLERERLLSANGLNRSRGRAPRRPADQYDSATGRPVLK